MVGTAGKLIALATDALPDKTEPDLRRARVISPVLRRLVRFRGFEFSPSSTLGDIAALAAEAARASILDSDVAMLWRLLSLTADFITAVSVYASIRSKTIFCSSIFDKDAVVAC